jgi:N6-L-threonylcarbamoyladenine synthase
MLILTIESSCDETSAAIIQDGARILSNVVASQIPIHARFGGVVPELASRSHILDIHTVIDDALEQAHVTLKDLDAIAVTCGPGLVGSLLVGIETAKSLAYVLNIPCIGLNHLEAHLTAPLLELDDHDRPNFPYIGMVVSGGHSDLYLVRAIGDYTTLGRTRDDAAGEAFDKVAKLLGLPYPGGIQVDRLAASGDPHAISFTRPMWTKKNLDFSFAGLKTAVLQHVQQHGLPQGQALNDLCASFQQAVVDVLLLKLFAAANQHRVSRVVLSGGVACNSRLRAHAIEQGAQKRIRVHIAPPSLCTDNAAMLGPIAHHYLQLLDPHERSSFNAFSLGALTNMAFGHSARTTKDSPRPHR